MKKEKKLTKKELKKIEKRETKKKFKEWSINVRNRDNNQCVICKSTKMLNAHHLFPREIKELRFELDNGISLCPKHHKYSIELSAHRNSIAFLIWLKEHKKDQYERLIKLHSQKVILNTNNTL